MPKVVKMNETSLITEDVLLFSRSIPRECPIMGLDLGTKTIGLAISDRRARIASALETIRRTKFTQDAEKLAKSVKQHGILGLVLGLPRNMDGSLGPRAQSTRSFARNLHRNAHFDGPILLWDERLSTVAAERSMLEADLSRKRRSEIIDQVAASYILQGALDRLSNIRAETALNAEDQED